MVGCGLLIFLGVTASRRHRTVAEVPTAAPATVSALHALESPGRLRLSALPAAAGVWMDGRFLAQIPQEGFKLMPGTHRIQLRFNHSDAHADAARAANLGQRNQPVATLSEISVHVGHAEEVEVAWSEGSGGGWVVAARKPAMRL